MKKGHKILALISRVLLGLTFVFSGFVKAVDPLGTTYKIQDYLQAFGLSFFDQYALFFSFAIFCFEFVLGMALLLGTSQRFFSWLAFVFMSLMTLLTLVIALGNPVSDCGCFGDALLLSNWQTFGKNIILTVLAILLISNKAPLYKVFGKKTQKWATWVCLLMVLLVGIHSLRHLPMLDFRPYKTGNHIPELMQIPPGAPMDSVVMEYIYEKEGVYHSFSLENYPAGDTSWTFVDRKEKVIRRGYEPPIHDFVLLHPAYGDITQEVLNNSDYTFLWVSYKLEYANRAAVQDFLHIQRYAAARGYPFYALTASDRDIVDEWIYEYDIPFDFCTVDEITLKTMIRSNPGLMLLKNGQILHKWAWRDLSTLIKDLDLPLEETYWSKAPSNKELVVAAQFFVLVLIALCFLYLFRLTSLLWEHRRLRKQMQQND
ncbi:MAG: DoxX family protein [Bacteroidales bacterium]|nr:DoxX family protein [Bacteroidales bacterium]MDD4430428.1 DoxX family protein [Bacteroidales bacterium]